MRKVEYSKKALLQFFLEHPNTAYKPKAIYKRFSWNPGTVRMEIKRLKDEGIVKQNPDNSYVLLDSKQIGEYLNNHSKRSSKISESNSPTPKPPHKNKGVRIMSHGLKLFHIDFSGKPLYWMKKLNILTYPSPNDRAQNVGLREDLVKYFSMGISLKTGIAQVYPLADRDKWIPEFNKTFYWCKDIIKRIDGKGVREEMEIANNFKDLKEKFPNQFKDIEIDDIIDVKIETEGLKLVFNKSQFPKDGEVEFMGERTKVLDAEYNLLNEFGKLINKSNTEGQINKKLKEMDIKFDILINNLSLFMDRTTNIINDLNNIKENKIKPDEKIEVA